MEVKKVWIIGASSGLGRQIAENLAAEGESLVLSARNLRDLHANCQHIALNFKVQSESFPFDLTNIKNEPDAQCLISEFIQKFGFPDTVYMVAGAVSEMDFNLSAATCLPHLLAVNFIGPSLLLSSMIRCKPDAAELRIVIGSSVAAIRPRSKNIAYGTAKKSLEQFCFGILHSRAILGVKIQIIRFGYMDTNMSYGHQLPFPAADLKSVSKKLMSLERKPSGLYYVPGFWRFISYILQLIPFFIYKKLKF